MTFFEINSLPGGDFTVPGDLLAKDSQTSEASAGICERRPERRLDPNITSLQVESRVGSLARGIHEQRTLGAIQPKSRAATVQVMPVSMRRREPGQVHVKPLFLSVRGAPALSLTFSLLWAAGKNSEKKAVCTPGTLRGR